MSRGFWEPNSDFLPQRLEPTDQKKLARQDRWPTITFISVDTLDPGDEGILHGPKDCHKLLIASKVINLDRFHISIVIILFFSMYI